MRYFLQYHNVEKLGWVPLDEAPFLQTRLSIGTRKPVARRSVGATVFVIVGLVLPADAKGQRERRFYLWEHFTVEGVQPEGDDLCVHGTGRQLMPPVLLQGEEFLAFRRQCANFIGFRSIDELAYTKRLVELCERSGEINAEVERFCTSLIEMLPACADVHFYRGFVRQRLGRHLDAITDLAEAIRRGSEFAVEAKECLRNAAGCL